MTRTARRFKNAIYGELARVGKAVANPHRLEILDLLCEGPRSVDVIAGQIGQSPANTSHHLQVLAAAGLVAGERSGTYVTYSVAGDEIAAFLDAVRDIAETRLAEVERVKRLYFEERDALEPLDSAGLAARLRSGPVTLLDVRPAEEYAAGHVPGARSVPLEDLERHIEDLPRAAEIIAYCRGPYCVLAMEAVERLRAHGLQARRMHDGVREWRSRGYEIEKDMYPDEEAV